MSLFNCCTSSDPAKEKINFIVTRSQSLAVINGLLMKNIKLKKITGQTSY